MTEYKRPNCYNDTFTVKQVYTTLGFWNFTYYVMESIKTGATTVVGKKIFEQNYKEIK